MSVEIGSKVPDFTAPSTGGPVRLAALRGSVLVIYFYPRDATPGCTTESRDFAALHGRFVDAGVRVLGVSRDSLASHEKFREKQSLPFDLVSDESEELCSLFSVVKMKNMYGKKVRGIERSTFLLDRSGVLRREWRGVKVPGHAEEVLREALALIAANPPT